MVYGLEINPTNFAPAKISNLGTILNVVLPLLQAGAALLFLATLLQAGFTWVTAGDKPENIAKARKKIFFAIIGLLIVVLSFVFVKIISYMLGINNLPF
jgi:hypothetical protein